jgi:hypothetical protein
LPAAEAFAAAVKAGETGSEAWAKAVSAAKEGAQATSVNAFWAMPTREQLL